MYWLIQQCLVSVVLLVSLNGESADVRQTKHTTQYLKQGKMHAARIFEDIFAWNKNMGKIPTYQPAVRAAQGSRRANFGLDSELEARVHCNSRQTYHCDAIQCCDHRWSPCELPTEVSGTWNKQARHVCTMHTQAQDHANKTARGQGHWHGECKTFHFYAKAFHLQEEACDKHSRSSP